MTLIERVSNSLERRGLFGTVWAIGGNIAEKAVGAVRSIPLQFAKLDDKLFDVRHGTDTRGLVPVSEYEVVGENKSLGTGYQAVRPRSLWKVVGSIPFPPGSVFVDIGSGKGRALLLASRFPFKRIVGLEFVPVLCDVARKNIELYRRRHKLPSEFEVHAVDATTFEFRGDENVIFMNNPFEQELVGLTLANITRSLKKHPRKIWLLYMFPKHERAVLENSPFRRTGYMKFPGRGRDCAIYEAG